MTDISIKRADASDAPTIAALMDALNEHFEMDSSPTDPDGFRALMEGEDPLMTGYLAFRGKVAVGYALCQKFYDTDTGTMATWLLDLYVDPDLRGHGLGRQLMARVASDASLKKQRCLGLSVYRDNPARRLYDRLGGALDPEALVYEIRDADLERLASESQV